MNKTLRISLFIIFGACQFSIAKFYTNEFSLNVREYNSISKNYNSVIQTVVSAKELFDDQDNVTLISQSQNAKEYTNNTFAFNSIATTGVDTSSKVTVQTFLKLNSLDEWLTYSEKYSNVIAKCDKETLQKKITELCKDIEDFSRLMKSNPSYVNKSVLELIGINYVIALRDVFIFNDLFPNSQYVEKYINSKENGFTRDEKIEIVEKFDGTQKLSSIKSSLIATSNSFNEFIEIAKVCKDCREELAGKCVGLLKSSSDYRRFLSYFENTKYAAEINTKYNEMVTKKAENLGENINSEYADYGPVISPDGSTMYFTRNLNPDSYGGEDIYFSKLDKNGEWTKAENIRTPLNNSEHNGVYSVSQDGQELFLHNDYESSGNNPSITKLESDGWSFPETQKIPNIQSKGSYHNGTLSVDGKYLLMSVKRDDSYGGRFLLWKTGGNDIYVIIKDSNGNWSEPKNLGSTINTSEEEGSVFMAADGQTIYFSSAGHVGYGAQDMFMSRRLDDTWTNWTTPLNLGATINSSGDDDFYVIPAKGDFIYFSSDRDGYGIDDIFRIGLPIEMRPKPVAVVKGNVRNKKDNKPMKAKVVYEDLETGVQLGSVQTNPTTGEYQIILVSGKKYGITPTIINETFTEIRVETSNEKTISTNGGKSGVHSSNANTEPVKQSAIVRNEIKPKAIAAPIDTSNVILTKQDFQSNSNTVKAIAESQNIDLTNLTEYTVIEQTLTLVPVESGQSISLNNLFFETASWVLKKESFYELNRIVKILIDNPTIKIEIGGHTDDKGSDETNLQLSEKRAFEVFNYMISKSVSKERLIYVGYGETKPKVPNTTDANRATNRRVELKIR